MRDAASSKLEKLIATLQQELELTRREIADILWLAQQSQTTVEETSNSAVKWVHRQMKPNVTTMKAPNMKSLFHLIFLI